MFIAVLKRPERVVFTDIAHKLSKRCVDDILLKRYYKGLKGPLSQIFPTKCGNVVLMIHFWLLSNLSAFQGYPESVSWWRQLQKTKSLSWIYWCITSRPWRSKRPCSERPQMLTSSSTTIATATHWWIGKLVNTNLLVPTLSRHVFLYLLLGMPILTNIGVIYSFVPLRCALPFVSFHWVHASTINFVIT